MIQNIFSLWLTIKLTGGFGALRKSRPVQCLVKHFLSF
jgi:hypothetical protein